MSRWYEIAAKSPGADRRVRGQPGCGAGDPEHFEKYFMPEYEKQAAVLHGQGKFMSVHMDGRLGVLKQLIAKTPVDIIEALHPPPMGDVPIAEALRVWKDKTLWLGFPGSDYASGPEATRQFALGLLREIGTTDRLAIAMSTENQVSDENLLR